MAVTEINARDYLRGDTVRNRTYPVSVISDWFPLLTAGAIDTADNSGSVIRNPGGITAADHNLVNVATVNVEGSVGTSLMMRMQYDDGITSVTPPVIQVFGRDNDGNWMPLPNRALSFEVTFTPDLTNDSADGTYYYTRVDMEDHVVDMLGCTKILCTVKTALAATGTVSTATLQGKIV